MANEVRIPLSKPVIGHKGPINEVVLRPPTFDEYMAYGDPYIWVPTGVGNQCFAAENMDVIRAYAKVLIVEPSELLMPKDDFLLAQKVKGAIMGFFLADAEAPKEGLKT